MKRKHWVSVASGMLAVMLMASGFSAELVIPRFPDSALPGVGQGEDALSNQGQVYISGTLLVSPCVLSDWAVAMEGRDWTPGTPGTVTIALEGCGDGVPVVKSGGTSTAPLAATSRWESTERFSVRLTNGANHLTLPIPENGRGVRLEMTYE